MNQNGKLMLKTISMQNFTLVFLVIVAGLISADNVAAQDEVFLIEGQAQKKLIGKIQEVTPVKVVVVSGGGAEEVSPAVIDRIEFEGEPRQVSRARSHIRDGRYPDCLEELQKITGSPGSDLIRQEIDFLKAYATARNALSGGGTTAEDAGRVLAGFLGNNSNTYHYVPATEALGQLLLAVNRLDLAEAEFTKLTQSGWPAYVARGHLQLGRTQLLQNKLEPAKANFRAIDAAAGTDEAGRSMKLVAVTQIAAIDAQSGNTDAAITAIKDIIRTESADDHLLFGKAYNSLGLAYDAAGEPKRAALAYLHTQLLFTSDADTHAEALFRLAQLWPTLSKPDRANNARSILLGRYPNSYWAKQL